MSSDPLTPPGPPQPRPYYVEGKPLWLCWNTLFDCWGVRMIASDHEANAVQGGISDWYGPYSPSLLWQRPQLPAGTVALLLEAADALTDAATWAEVGWNGAADAKRFVELAARLRAEAGKGEGT